jgi:hypothetical protein
MSSTSKSRPGLLICLLCLLLACCATPIYAQALQPAEESEAWLVTYGPGEIYWQRFGHNAIWIRDPGLGLDHVFNFGFFDFQQQGFFLRFLQGRMLYFSAARPARDEFAGYIDENRSIRAQKLDLSAQQKLRLVEYLLQEVRPENRDYLYDYYYNNCSTRVRDAIDGVLGGILKSEFDPLPAGQTLRDHTRRLTAGDFWLYLGVQVGLGPRADRMVSRWDEMFIPGELAQTVEAVEFTGAGLSRPLVLEDVVLYQSTLDPPPATPRAWWPGYLLGSLGVVLAAWLLCRFTSQTVARRLSRSWLVLSGLVGLVLAFLWLGTDHAITAMNLNLLVFSPLWLVLAFWKRGEKVGLFIIAGLSVLALIMTLLPPYQYTLDVLAAFLPVNLAAGLGLFRSRILPAGQPGVPGSVDR